MYKNFFDKLVNDYMVEVPEDNEYIAKENVYKILCDYIFNNLVTYVFIGCFIITKFVFFR